MISFCRGGRSRFRFTDCTSHSIPIPNPSLRKKRRKNIISGTSHYYHLGRVLGFCHNKIYLITPSSLIVSQFSVTPPPLYALLAMTDSPSTALDSHVIPSKILCPRPLPFSPAKILTGPLPKKFIMDNGIQSSEVKVLYGIMILVGTVSLKVKLHVILKEKIH